MNIGIDANCLIFEKAGVGKYTHNIIKNLIKIDKKNRYFLYFTFLRNRKKRIRQVEEFLGKPRSKRIHVRIIPLPAQWYEFLISTVYPIEKIIKDKIDIFFAPYASGIPKRGFKNMVVMVHDLVFLRFPEHRGKKLSNYYLKRHKIAIKNCQKIIVPSKATKNDLRKFLKVDPRKIDVIYEAVSEELKIIKKINTEEVNKKIRQYFDPKIKYILSVGTIEPRKNLNKLVEAYSILPHNIQKEYKLVIVGQKGWNNSKLFKTIENLNIKDKVIFTGFVKDEDLPYIYNKAKVFVYPSLYEGFGLPPLEALACGVPVIVSNTSSLPEVVGRAAIVVDCQNEKIIAETIKKAILNEKIVQKLKLRSKIQIKKFSWEKAARETLKVFEHA